MSATTVTLSSTVDAALRGPDEDRERIAAEADRLMGLIPSGFVLESIWSSATEDGTDVTVTAREEVAG